MPVGQPHPDEESLVRVFPDLDRKAQGAFFTPAPLVQWVLDRAKEEAPPGVPLTVIDPACGAGAFLSAAAQRFEGARLFGLELHANAARYSAERVPKAHIVTGDALRGGFDALVRALPDDGFELWVGNPPYNGTSAVLQDASAYRRLRALLSDALPRGTSLRDDYVFFLLLAAERLRQRPGAIAFVTSATLLDAYLYAPVRRALLGRLQLAHVAELGGGAFQNTRVRTCVTVWTTGRRGSSRYAARACSGVFHPEQLCAPANFTPEAPDYLLRPQRDDASELDQQWRANGEPLTTLVPVSSPGLKTRFDELLVDDDADRLLSRVAEFLRTRPEDLQSFAARHAIPERHLPKLIALREAAAGVEVDAACVRPFYRYAGARHRGAIPETARAHCYLDRRLIPRGDHRLRGQWDPHQGDVKLVFNVRELPLSAALLEREGCVHDHRHARFAPLLVPQRLLTEGLMATRRPGALGPLCPNLSERGAQWAAKLGGPKALFAALVRFINSAQVQQVWAPSYGAVRELCVTLEALEHHA